MIAMRGGVLSFSRQAAGSRIFARGMSSAGGAQDLVVIGGGPGGYVAAIRAAQLGLKVGPHEVVPSVWSGLGSLSA